MILLGALESSLRNYLFSDSDYGYNRTKYKPTYEDNSVFSKFLEVIIPYEGRCFVPVLGISYILRIIDTIINYSEPVTPVKFSYPLYVMGTDTKKTADSIIQSINKCPTDYRLSNIKTSKGLDYYGGQGIIFNDKWNPMMLCGFIIDIDRVNRRIHIVNPICYVSPSVFTNNDILSKALVKKVIPYLSTEGVNAPISIRALSYVDFTYSSFRYVPITIECLDKYFVTPTAPSNIDTLDDDIWNFLSRNIEDLV